MSDLIEDLAFTRVESAEASFEASSVEYEVEIYLEGFDIEEIKSKAVTHCSQEQWGIFVPKTDANASSGSIRVRKSVSVDDETKYELTTKTSAGDSGKNEHEIDTDDVQFEQFKRFADQGLIKTRYEFPGQLEGGIDFTYEVDVFYNARGELVPWVKIDAELPVGTPFNPEMIPLTYTDRILITPELKGRNEVLEKKIANLYEKYFRAMNVYVGTTVDDAAVIAAEVPTEQVNQTDAVTDENSEAA